MPASQESRGEHGLIILLTAIAMVGLITVCAFVVDVAVLKSDRRVDRGAADAAATAAALDLDGSNSALANACADGWAVALQNLRVSSAGLTSPCSSFPVGATCAPATPVNAIGTATGLTITITIPVVASSTLMSATAIGGDTAQSANALDGTPCQRVGVAIQRVRTSVFGGVVATKNESTTIHSVARYVTSRSATTNIPALIALNKTGCPTVDASSGIIHVYNNGTHPGFIGTDSVASASGCSSSTPFSAGSPGSIIADPSSNLIAGTLGYSAATQAKAFSSTGTYVGTPTYEMPITRAYPDNMYHCGNVTPVPSGCTTGSGGTDAISDLQARYGQTGVVPGAFTTFPTGAQSCASIPSTFAAGNWYINCPAFALTSAASFTSGDVIFAGDISLGAHALLTINSANSADSAVVIRGTGGVTTSSNTWQLIWNRTTVLMTNTACQTTISSCGTMMLHDGTGTWTAPQTGSTKGLIYWTETSQTSSFLGNPLLSWSGVYFAGSSIFDLQGNAVVDASTVQLWVDSVALHNASARLYLKPDPATSISTYRAGSALVR